MDARELREDRARCTSEPCFGLPLLQGLPERIGDEAHEDMGFDALLLVVPDRADRQIGLVDAKRRFRLGELDVGGPEFFVAPLGDVGAQNVRSSAKIAARAPNCTMSNRATPISTAAGGLESVA